MMLFRLACDIAWLDCKALFDCLTLGANPSCGSRVGYAWAMMWVMLFGHLRHVVCHVCHPFFLLKDMMYIYRGSGARWGAQRATKPRIQKSMTHMTHTLKLLWRIGFSGFGHDHAVTHAMAHTLAAVRYRVEGAPCTHPLAPGRLADRRPPTADRRPPTADRRPPTADRPPGRPAPGSAPTGSAPTGSAPTG